MKRIAKERIVEYLTYHVSADVVGLAENLSVRPQRIRECLTELLAEGLVMTEENETGKVYKLKA